MPALRAPTEPGDIDSRLRHVEDRIARSEWKAEVTDKRLHEGAESFEMTRQSLELLRSRLEEAIRPKPFPAWKLAGLFAGLVSLVAGWIWQAARYPDRQEFQSLQSKVDTELEKLRESHRILQTDAALIKASQERQEGVTGELVRKLDEALRSPR